MESTLEQKQLQMRKGLVEFCILLVINEKRTYSSDILNALKKSGLLVVEGTLYPLLSRLRTQLLVDYEWEESKSGPPRKYYVLTTKGKTLLSELKKTWAELSTSIESLIN